MRISWSREDEVENINKFGITFSEASQVVKNSTSLHIRNIEMDFTFIGPVDDISKILLVYCVPAEGLRKILLAKKASLKEENAYFMHLASGDLK